MHDITVTININTNTITVSDLTSLDAFENRVIVKAVSIVDGEGDDVTFNRFRAGIYLRDATDETVVLDYYTYPITGDNLEYSPDGVLFSKILTETEPNESYVLHVYAEDAGDYYEKRFNLTLPKTERPYDHLSTFNSWTWNDSEKEWEAPVAKPEDQEGHFAKWSEADLNWVQVSID